MLHIIPVVVIAANLAGGGIDGVALPSLPHERFGAAGYGALLACFAAGSILGTLASARTGGLRHLGPALFFPIAGGLVAVAILYGLTQREFREFGAQPSVREADASATMAPARAAG